MTPISAISSYHAHIYFNGPEQRAAALALRERIAERFAVQLGRVHEALVGPHARPMYQVAFSTGLFSHFVPWLMLNRQDLAVLVHPDTGHARGDHLRHALWLGETLPILHADMLPEDGGLDAPPVANTTPSLEP